MPKSPVRFDRHVHILVTKDMHEFVKNDLNGGMGHHIRNMIRAWMGHYDKELTELEREFAITEATYFSQKKRIEELRAEKKQMEEEKIAKEKRIEESKKKLLDALELENWHIERIPKNTFKIYSDYTGLSIEELKAFLTGEIQKREKEGLI